jgi:hypothetical protein
MANKALSVKVKAQKQHALNEKEKDTVRSEEECCEKVSHGCANVVLVSLRLLILHLYLILRIQS